MAKSPELSSCQCHVNPRLCISHTCLHCIRRTRLMTAGYHLKVFVKAALRSRCSSIAAKRLLTRHSQLRTKSRRQLPDGKPDPKKPTGAARHGLFDRQQLLVWQTGALIVNVYPHGALAFRIFRHGLGAVVFHLLTYKPSAFPDAMFCSV